MLWWPLVDASRAFVLTGFLALVEPGTLLQLFCGVVFALCFTSLQSFSAPYRMETNNFLAYIANVAIVLNLLGSLGAQINATYYARAVNSTLLSVVLFVAGTGTLVLTLLPLCASLRRGRQQPHGDRHVVPLLAPGVASSGSQHVAPSDPAINSTAGSVDAGDS